MPPCSPEAAAGGHRAAVGVPLHSRIRAELERLILSGQWPPGHRIPSEHDLMARYGCARMTISKVLAQMAEDGWIERRRKVGSFVRRALSSSAVLEVPDVADEVQRTGQPYGYRLHVRRRRRALRDDRDRLGLDEPGPVLWLECLHLAGDRPFVREERLINLRVVPAAALEPFDGIAPGRWLIQYVPWTMAEHRIRAVSADPTLAEALSIAPGHACLVTERRTWTADQRPVTWARLSSPAELRELVARFSPSGTRRRPAGPAR